MSLLSLVPVYYRWAAIAALVVAWSAFWYVKGCSHVHSQWDAATAKAEALQLGEVQRLAAMGEKVTVKYVTHTKVIHDAIQSQPLVVTAQDDNACALPVGFDRVWNSVNRASSAAPASPDASPAEAVRPRP